MPYSCKPDHKTTLHCSTAASTARPRCPRSHSGPDRLDPRCVPATLPSATLATLCSGQAAAVSKETDVTAHPQVVSAQTAAAHPPNPPHGRAIPHAKKPRSGSPTGPSWATLAAATLAASRFTLREGSIGLYGAVGCLCCVTGACRPPRCSIGPIGQSQ